MVAENDILLTEEFVKGGCPSHLRGRLWKQILQSHVGDKVNKTSRDLIIGTFSPHHPSINLSSFFSLSMMKERAYFQAKRMAVIQTEYLTDKIIIKVWPFPSSSSPPILIRLFRNEPALLLRPVPYWFSLSSY